MNNYLDATGLTYLWKKMHNAFAEKQHNHKVKDISDLRIGGHNLAVYSTVDTDGCEKVGRYGFIQNNTDTKDGFYLSIDDYNGQAVFTTYIQNYKIEQEGTVSLKITTKNNYTQTLRIKHNGNVKDVVSKFHLTDPIPPYTDIVVSITFVCVEQGWFEWKNVMIECGTVPSYWSPAPEDIKGQCKIPLKLYLYRDISRTSYGTIVNSLIKEYLVVPNDVDIEDYSVHLMRLSTTRFRNERMVNQSTIQRRKIRGFHLIWDKAKDNGEQREVLSLSLEKEKAPISTWCSEGETCYKINWETSTGYTGTLSDVMTKNCIMRGGYKGEEEVSISTILTNAHTLAIVLTEKDDDRILKKTPKPIVSEIAKFKVDCNQYIYVI